ncbi:hypothetical protein N665_0002s0074, partial [Sinapis alba]
HRVKIQIRPTDHECIKRIEPLKLVFVDTIRDIIVLNRSTSNFDERLKCERLFNMTKHVHYVLLSIAEDKVMDLEKGNKLRFFMLKRIKMMQYFSWRIEAPWILNLCHLIQKIATCWAFAFVRQLEAYLKLNVGLPVFSRFHQQGSKTFVFSRVSVPMDNYLLVYIIQAEPAQKVPTMIVCFEGDCSGGDFEERMMEELKKCPIYASVIWFKSYHGVIDDRIFKPTDLEQAALKRIDGGGRKSYHTMLLTCIYSTNSVLYDFTCHCLYVLLFLIIGHGVNIHGERYLEFQDFNGDVNNGDRGFVRAEEPNPVIQFAEFQSWSL